MLVVVGSCPLYGSGTRRGCDTLSQWDTVAAIGQEGKKASQGVEILEKTKDPASLMANARYLTITPSPLKN